MSFLAMMKKYCWITLILILAGCAPNSGLGIATATLQPFHSPTVMPVATWTASPTLTPTPRTIPSHQISTPIAKEKKEITLELLRTNNGCNLPCWWGIIPNQTSWSDSEKFLKSFSTIYERQPPSEWFVYDIRSPISEEFSEIGIVEVVFAARDGIVKEIEISGFNEKSYYLSAVLLRYGVPSQVLVSTYSSDYGLSPNKVPLSIDLYYPERGINVLYGTYATVKDERISGCLENPHLFLWSPLEYDRSIDYILGWNKDRTPYMSIEKATDLDIQTFYEKYADSKNEPCLDTPTSLWPAQ